MPLQSCPAPGHYRRWASCPTTCSAHHVLQSAGAHVRTLSADRLRRMRTSHWCKRLKSVPTRSRLSCTRASSRKQKQLDSYYTRPSSYEKGLPSLTAPVSASSNMMALHCSNMSLDKSEYVMPAALINYLVPSTYSTSSVAFSRITGSNCTASLGAISLTFFALDCDMTSL